MDTSAYLNLGVANYYAGSYGDGETALKKCFEINPEFPVARAYLARVYLMRGNNDEALRMAQQERDEPWRLYASALALHALGRKPESDAALSELISKYKNVFAFQIIEVYAWRGEEDVAFDWLDRAYSLRDAGLTEIKGDPLLRSLQKDPRYAAFMKKMNFPE